MEREPQSENIEETLSPEEEAVMTAEQEKTLMIEIRRLYARGGKILFEFPDYTRGTVFFPKPEEK